MTKLGYTLTMLVASLGVAACTTDTTPDDPTGNTPPPGATTGSDGNTFDHDNNGISVWDLIERLQKEGPARYTSYVHSCPKVRVATLGNVLTSVGIDINNQTALSAGDLYRNGVTALGAANYPNRIRENIGVTTSGASREFDIFAAGAQEVIDKLPTLARCTVGGVGVQLFDANNSCRADGITCLIGVPAQAAHVDLCNLTVSRATDVTTGKRLAVAALLAAAYTCE